MRLPRHLFLIWLALLLVGGASLSGCRPPAKETSGPSRFNGTTVPRAIIETAAGEIEIEFFPAESPKAVENFLLLAERGYYNGLTFHRIVKGFMIQGGDPQGNGKGGESAWGGFFDDTIERQSPLYRRNYRRGIVAMANMGPNTNGSQFFIMHQDYPLPPQYVIFGQVVRGMETVDALAELPTQRGPDRQMSQPLTPPVMQRIRLKEAPAASP